MKRTAAIIAAAAALSGAPAHVRAGAPSEGEPVAALDVAIREWEVPTRGSHPHDPAVGPDGALWYTAQNADRLGRLDPDSGRFQEYPVTRGSGPHGLAAGPDGNVWYTGNRAALVGKLDVKTGQVTDHRMPDPRAEDPHTPVFDPQGMLWFTVQGGNMVGRLDPRTGKIDLREVPTSGALPYGIAVDAGGVPYFCEFGTNRLASIDPATLAIREYALPKGARPRRLAVSADGSVYYTDHARGFLGRLEPATGKVKEWRSPGGSGSRPYGIAITPDGMVWYSESGVRPNTIVRFDPRREEMARAAIPSGGGVVRNMAATRDGRVYIACSGVNKVGVVEPRH